MIETRKTVLSLWMFLLVGCGSGTQEQHSVTPEAERLDPKQAAPENIPETETTKSEPKVQSQTHVESVEVVKAPAQTAIQPEATVGQALLSPESFEKAVAEVDALEADAEFFNAYKLVQKLYGQAADQAQKQALRTRMSNLMNLRREADPLRTSLQLLGSDNAQASIAKRKLSADGSEVVKILLRKEIAKGSPARAADAAEVLGEVNDGQAFPVMLKRYQANAEGEQALNAKLLNVMQELAKYAESEHLSPLLRELKNDSAFKYKSNVSILLGLLKGLGDDQIAFGEKLGDAAGFEIIKNYVKTAMEADKPEIVQWAMDFLAICQLQARFLKIDTTTSGNWMNVYGKSGFLMMGDPSSPPTAVELKLERKNDHIWANATTDERALKKTTADDRIAGCWYASPDWQLDLAFKDSTSKTLAVYLLDFDNQERKAIVQLLDQNGSILHTQDVPEYKSGVWLVYHVFGKVSLKFVNNNGPHNVTVSGFFFD